MANPSSLVSRSDWAARLRSLLNSLTCKRRRRPDRALELMVEPLETRSMLAVITQFAPRFATNDTGDIVLVANTLMTASSTDSGAAAARAGTGTRLNNNDFQSMYVDIDSDATTFNSSQANLTLPSGSQVLWAGLYWGAKSTSSARNTIRFDTPATSTYVNLTGTIIGSSSASDYQGFVNVTSLVQAGGSGTYTAANVQAATGGDRYAGWSLVVVYRDPLAPPRNLTVFDGYAVVDTSTPDVTLTISGFQAPPSGIVNAKVGVVAYEGDLGLTGDSLRLNSTTLTNSLNPSNNFFNSSITSLGNRVSSKFPDYVNQLGFDADLIAANGIIPNGATSATVNLRTGSEFYTPGVVTTAIDLYAPVLLNPKSVVDLNGGELERGDILEYTVAINNTAGDRAVSVVLTDVIPAATTYVPGTIVIASGANAGAKTDAFGDDQAEFDIVNNRIVIRLGTGATSTSGGSLAIGDSTTIRFRVRVNDGTPNNTVITNQASIAFASAITGFTLTSSSTAASTVVVPEADLALIKTVDKAAPLPGEAVTFTVTLSNNGPYAATGVRIQDLLPMGLTFLSATVGQGTYSSTSGEWIVGSLESGAAVTLTLRARADQLGTLVNTAQVIANDRFDPNSANNAAQATVKIQEADLVVTSTASSLRPQVGQTVTFTHTIRNDGPDAATNISVPVVAPAGFQLVNTQSSAGTYNSATGTWTLASLASGASATLVFTTVATIPTSVTSSLAVARLDQADSNTANNASSVTVDPEDADLAISKSISNTRPNVGETVTFTVSVTNVGGDATATNVLVTDQLPAGVTFISSTAGQGTYNDTTGVWTLGSLAQRQTTTLQIVARIDSPIPFDNTATVSATQFDPVAANNTTGVRITPQTLDLGVTGFVSNPSPNVGEFITYTFVLSNSGPDAASNVTVDTVLPAGVVFQSSAQSSGIYNAATGEWTVPTLAAGSSVTLSLVTQVVSPTPGAATAEMIAVDQYDSNAANNTTTAAIAPQQADVSIVATVDTPRPNVGQTVTYTVAVTNNGPNPATGITAQTLLPPGVNYVSNSGGASYDPGTGLWTIGSLASGATALLTITANVTEPGGGSLQATVSATQFDPITQNNLALVGIVPLRSDIALSASVDNPAPNVGDVVTYRLTAQNLGPDGATALVITDSLPAGVTLLSATPEVGTYNAATGVWQLDLASGTAVTLTVVARVDAATVADYSAQVTSAVQYDPNVSNNATLATVTPQQADLVISQTVSDPAPNVGDQITFTLTLTNAGPNTATDVLVSDILPPGVRFIGATPSVGSFDSLNDRWIVGNLADGATETLTLVVEVIRPEAGQNMATASATQFDPLLGNNTAMAAFTPQQADVAVDATVSDASPNVGDSVTFSVTVANFGPDATSGLVLSSLLPAGVDFTSASVSIGTYDAATGIWTLGDLASGATASLSVNAIVSEPTAGEFVASVVAVDQYDPNAANNADIAVAAPQSSDVAIDVAVSNPTPNPGDAVTLTFTVENLGPSPATNISVRELIPAGLEIVGSSTSLGGYDSTQGLWAIDSLTSGGTATLTVQVIARTPDVPEITAVVSARQFDANATNNSDSAAINIQSADLTVATQVSNSLPQVGETVTFTTTLSNNGPNTATNAVVATSLPQGYQLVSVAAGLGSYDPITGQWTVPTLASGETITLVFTAVAGTPDAVIFNAAVNSLDQYEPDLTDNTSSVGLDARNADLSVSQVVSNTRPNVGETVTLTITVSNAAGDSDATGVVLQELLPPGLTLQSATPSQGSYDSGTGNWTIGTIGQGDSVTLTLVAQVASPTVSAINAAIVAATEFDPQPSNNAAGVLIVPQQVDVGLTGMVSTATPNVGDTITYTFLLTNAGPDPATEILASVALPAGVTLQSSSTSLGTYDPSTGTWSVANLAPGSSTVLTITGLVVAPDPGDATATVVAIDQFDNNTGNNTASAAIDPQQADLVVTTTVNTPRPNVGDTVTFTITVSNDGPDAATSVVLRDQLPAGLTFVSSSAGASYDPVTGTLVVGTLASGATETFTLTATVDAVAGGTYRASATADQFDPIGGNNTATASVLPQLSDLALLASVSDPTPNVGQQIVYTLTLTNIGADTATNIVISDAFPDGVTFGTASPQAGVYNSGTGQWIVPTLAASETVTLTLSGTVAQPNPPAYTADIVEVDQFDPNIANNSTLAVLTPQQADLELSMTIDNAAPNVGDFVTFTVTLNNAGPNLATGVVVSDLLPPGVRYVDSNPSLGNFDPLTNVWTVGSVPSGDTQTLTLTVEVISAEPGVNLAFASGVQFDPQLADNTATAAYVPQQADLAVTTTVSDATPNVGDTITYTVFVNNFGPNTATDVSLVSMLPAGVSFVGGTATVGSFDPATGVWSLGDLGSGGNAVLTITATVIEPTTGALLSSIAGVDQFDPNPTNNAASAVQTPLQSDVLVDVQTNNASPIVGETITLTFIVTNDGPDTATSVAMQAQIPPGVTVAGFSPDVGTFDPTTGLWTIGSLNSSQSVTLTVQGVVSTPGAQSVAAVVSARQFDPTPGNNRDSTALTLQESDLSIVSAVDNSQPQVGESVVFTITLDNNGPNTATNVVIQQQLPSGYDFVSATPAGATTYDPQTGLWTVSSLASGDQVTLQIVATATSPVGGVNTATIVDQDQFDPNLTNNTSAVSVDAQDADLVVTQTVNNPSPNVGDTVVLTITVSNAQGDSPATGITLQDLLPSGLALQTATPTQGTYDSGTGQWLLGTLAQGQTETLTIVATVVSPTPQANTASVVAVDQFDPDISNNSAGVRIVPQQVDLGLTATVSDPSPNVGGTITYSVVLTNYGPDTATNISVADQLPTGVTFVSATSSAGGYDAGTGIWTVASLASGSSVTLTIVADVDAPLVETNTATLVAVDQFDRIAENNTATAAVSPQQADLTIVTSVDQTRPNVGDTVTFTVVVSNNGPNAADSVNVGNLLPLGVTPTGFLADQGTYDPATGIWSAGSLASGDSVMLTLTAVVSSAAGGSLASSVSAAQFDPNPADNVSTVALQPQRSDISLTAQVSNERPNVGEIVTYTLVVSNLGPDAVTNLVIDDELPAGVTLTGQSSTLGSYNPATGTWTIAALPPNGQATLTLTALVASPQPETYSASVTSADQFDPNVNNNTTLAQLTPQQADLRVTQSISNLTPNVGDLIDLTIVLTNTGPDAATGVVVSDLLPPGVRFAGSSATLGSFDNLSDLWTVGSLASGDTQTLVITVEVISPDPAMNIATASAIQFDPRLMDNTSIASFVPQQSDLAVVASISDPTPNVGDTVTFTVTLTNFGPNSASGVDLMTMLPTGLQFVSAAPGSGTFDPSTGFWMPDAIGSGASVTLLITALVQEPIAGTFFATIADADQFDPNASNNSAFATAAPQRADVSVNLTVDDLTPDLGSTVTFTLTVNNFGPSTATEVSLRELIPAGLEISGFTPSVGTYDPITGVWTVGSLDPGSPQTLTIQAIINGPGTLDVSVVVSGRQFDPTPANNSGSLSLVPNSVVSGNVYIDSDLSGTLSSGELGVNGVTVLLTGQTDGGTPVSLTTLTDASGNFTFTGVESGDYTITVVQPVGLLAGTFTSGTAGGTVNGSSVSDIEVGVGQTASGYNFGQLRPGRISGAVFVDGPDGDGTLDADGNGVIDAGDYDGLRQPGEAGVPGVTIQLIGLDDRGNAVNLVTQTGSDGSFAFENLRPGEYRLVQPNQPAGLLDWLESAGGQVISGSVGTDEITGIILGEGTQADNFGFADVAPALVSDTPFIDIDGDGVRDPDEPLYPSGTLVSVQGVDIRNPMDTPDTVAQPVIGSDGAFATGPLYPGLYQWQIVNPAASAPRSSLTGRVYSDANLNGMFDPLDVPIAGETLELIGIDFLGREVNIVTSTDSAGLYTFGNLLPGVYSIFERQAQAFFDEPESSNTNPASVPGQDSYTEIRLGSGVAGSGFDFRNLLPTRLNGVIFADSNGNGIRDADEDALADVTVTLVGTDFLGRPVNLTTVTDVDGFYTFPGLPPGNYDIIVQSPDGFALGMPILGGVGGNAQPGRVSGLSLPAVGLVEGYSFALGLAFDNLFLFSFGQPSLAVGARSSLLPFTPDVPAIFNPVPADAGDRVFDRFAEFDRLLRDTLFSSSDDGEQFRSRGQQKTLAAISGYVYDDVNGNGRFDPGDLPLSGVVVRLVGRGPSGTFERITTTDQDGYYLFAELEPGEYSVIEQQPAGYMNVAAELGRVGDQPGGSVADLNTFVGITLTEGAFAQRYNFGEARPAAFGGRVVVDTEMGDNPDPLANVKLLLRAADGTEYTAETDAQGVYSFAELRPGTYTLTLVPVEGFRPSEIKIGSGGGDPTSKQQMADVVLRSGDNARGYDFVLERETPAEDARE